MLYCANTQTFNVDIANCILYQRFACSNRDCISIFIIYYIILNNPSRVRSFTKCICRCYKSIVAKVLTLSIAYTERKVVVRNDAIAAHALLYTALQRDRLFIQDIDGLV